MTKSVHWQQRIGNQRDWVWRGWQTRYTYFRPLPTHRELTPPILLLHGFGTSIGHWRQNLEVLSQHYPVYALDMLGFGASRKAQADYKIDLWVDQVYEFWQTFIQQPMVLVGNSIGSLVCLSAAAAHPEMVSGMVMISLPDFSQREEAIPLWLRPIMSTIEGLVASPAILKSLFYLVRHPPIVRKWAGLAYANPEAVTAELVEILTEPARDKGAAATFSALFKAMTSTEFGPRVKSVLPTLDIPLLLIWGCKDRMIPPYLAGQFAALNPKLELVELENAGHCPHDECPEQVNQILLDWLSTCSTGGVTP
ncbi:MULTISPECIES: alpha/beta fold hydrolase [unclassified Coleofasciculus]|uniref:alpha/beta fold hydrolase n=1 Tax=unclassified Coleofasciculus TaxID=2692782 RepID=UPI0018805550|nr:MULTISPECIES: alpha/beta fold hydrolase [unclassified Coleofasciculus]MBE9128887.1 alpha/beta fold hydrolase [Coleofasciculus sp. LEGE 07081]MBE9151606.1 alpha/beta fold hydrolase [Coleofasciculus sp. LEGE 07092]